MGEMEKQQIQPDQINNNKQIPRMLYSKNKAYIFIPFSCSKGNQINLFEHSVFKRYISAINESNLWMRKKMHILYLLKYITAKYDFAEGPDNTRVLWKEGEMSDDLNLLNYTYGTATESDAGELDFDNTQCFHFSLNIKEFEKHSPVRFFQFYQIYPYRNQLENGMPNFQFIGAELFCFSTLINILVIQIEFDDNTPIRVSNAEYMLKRIFKRIVIYNQMIPLSQRDSGDISFVEIFKKSIQVAQELQYDIFFFANADTARANILTLLEVPKKDDYSYELYYLKKCYSDGFLYSTSPDNEKEIYSSSSDVIWGLSTEAAICLICPEMGRERFLKDYFFKNFQTQYLFMYIILLHQKYMLYKFLTDLDTRSSKDLNLLENYKDCLYQFETDFVFSCITEVPQYQNIYDRLIKIFSLKEMYEDVHEPLISLSEVRYKTDEETRQKQDKKINIILFFLSLLGIFSAWVDSYDFIKSFLSEHLHATVGIIKTVQISVVLFIVAIIVLLIYRFFRLSKEQHK